MARGMATRIRQIKGRQGWYVYLDVPRWVRQRKGGSASIRFKGGATEAEAKRNCLSIEAKQLNKWEAIRDPLGNASVIANQTGESIDIVVDDLVREAGWSHEWRNRVSAAMTLDADELDRQQIKPLDAQMQGVVGGLVSGVSTWQEWVALRQRDERHISKSTITNWKSKLKGLSAWIGHDHIGVMTRQQAFEYKLHMLQVQGKQDISVLTYISSLSGMWNWAIRSGQLEGENIWQGLKKGLSRTVEKDCLDIAMFKEAELKADKLEDIRFWFGRYQGLRKEDYCGLRWGDIDMDNGVFYLLQYEWNGQMRNLKMKKKGERTIPIHSELLKRIKLYLPEALTNNSNEPIWSDDYRSTIESWGSRFAERFKDRYGFGTHDLRSYVVTELLKMNISPYFLKEITGHTVPGMGKVVAGYNRPNIEQVREVIELLN